MISLDKWNEICNFVDDLCTTICIPSETKGLDVKVFNLITTTNKVETLVKQILMIKKYDVKNGLLYFANVFISDHVTIHDCHYLL